MKGTTNSDSPGYALNLIRLPISLLPGKHTQNGYGAEISFTAPNRFWPRPPSETFRGLVLSIWSIS